MTKLDELPLLIQRCLECGVRIYSQRFNAVMAQYKSKKVPDDVLKKWSFSELQKYIDGLYYCSCEAAGDWVDGLEKLKNLGFVEKVRTEGHRRFISVEWKGDE